MAGTITLTANGPASLTSPVALNVGGIVGGLGSNVTLTTTGAATNSILVGGVVSGNTVSVDSISTVTTTKAISGLGAGSTVTITGTAASSTANAVTIGGAVTGLTIDIALDGGAPVGSLAINAAVGGLTSNAVTINATGGAGQTIVGKGVIGGDTVNLDATGAIGSAKAPVLTSGLNLNVNGGVGGGANIGGTFISQKGNVTIGTIKTDNFVAKVTGTTSVAGIVTVGTLNLNSSGLLTIGPAATGTSTINISGPSTGASVITALGGLTTVADSGTGTSIATVAGQPVTINVTGAASINGALPVTTLTMTTSGALTIGKTGSITGTTDTITSKGAISDLGILGNTNDVLKITSSGALSVGSSVSTATLVGATGSTVTGLTVANYGSATGDLAIVATGTGNAFVNDGTLGSAGDPITVSAAKGAIVGIGGTIAASTVGLTAASVNLNFSGTTNINQTAVTGALNLTDNSGDLTVGGTGAGGTVVGGSVNISYAQNNNNTLTINNVTASNGNLVISSAAKALVVATGALLNATNGNITIQNNNTSGGETISVGDNATIHATTKTNLAQGNVYIVIGAVPSSPVMGMKPAGVTPNAVLPGVIYYGTNGFVSTSTTLNATGRNIVFSTNGLAASAITLGSTVVITADPPVNAGGIVGAVANANAVAIAPVSSQVQTSSGTISTDYASTSALSSGSSIASAINPSITTMTVGNPTLGASFFAGLGSNATGLSTLDGVMNGSVAGVTVSDAESVSAASGAARTGMTGARTLSGKVSNASHRTLDRGPLLLLPEQNTVVDTPFGTVNVAANSVALIISSDNGLAVYNLHDARKNAVTINNGGAKPIAIVPGRSAVLAASSAKSFEEVNPVPFVAYRNVATSTANDAKVYQTEFDMLSMVRGLPALKHLITSENAATRKTMSNMLKTAAILTQISQSSEAYSLYLTPAKTAFLSSTQR